MQAAKAAWVVTAGVLPGTIDDEYTLQLGYTSSDYEADKETADENDRIMEEAETEKELDEVKDTLFMQRRDRALEHAKEIMNPSRVNWVRVEFIWY